jgi:hypothetical protein
VGGSKRIAFKGLVLKPEGNIQHGRARYRWEVNIKIRLKQIGWVGVHCIVVAEARYKWQCSNIPLVFIGGGVIT